MDIKNSDFILILDLEDIHGQKMRVADTAEFTVRVWTNDPTHYLTFKRRDIISDDYNDRIAIDKMQMECLHSGVVVYDYDYSKWNADFSSTDEKYNKVKTVVTDVYWRNIINPDNPCNVVNYQTIEHIYDLIEAERLEREKDFYGLEDYVKNEYTNKLDAEVERSNNVDIEFHKLIKENKEAIDALKETVKESTDNGTDLQTAVNNEVTRATNTETVLNTKIEGEIERSRTADDAVRNAVEIERDRAIAKETLINDTLTSEIARAKAVEGDITNSVVALKNRYLNFATREDVDNRIQDIVGEAPEALDTLAEIAAKLEADSDVITTINGVLEGKATKDEVTAIDNKITEHISTADDKYATKSEVDTALNNKANKTETTAIQDNEGNVITEMIIDNSDADDSVEVYTREQVDNKLNDLIRTYTQEEYDALTDDEKNKGIIIIL